MGLPFDRIKAEALDLSRGERAQLAHRLLESLDESADEDLDAVEKAWQEEIGRRVAELDAGRAELIPGEQVFAELRARRRE